MHFINLSGYLAASVQIKPVDPPKYLGLRHVTNCNSQSSSVRGAHYVKTLISTHNIDFDELNLTSKKSANCSQIFNIACIAF